MEFLQYDLHVAVLIAIFYIFWRLLLSRDNLHELNRIVLVSTAIVSFILPLCIITIHKTELLTVTSDTTAAITSSHGAVSPETSEVSVPWWQTAAVITFWAGAVITLLYTILSISKVCILISRCEKHRQADGTIIAVADREVSPFSWMRYIVLSCSDYAHPDKAILLHEHEHIRRHHSWDVVLVDVLTSLQWFNPTIWMLRSDLQTIHEYEADAAVLSAGVDMRQYQYLLIRKAVATSGYSVVNGINHSTLKNRIAMINFNKNTRHAWLKALYVLPVVAISLVTSARTVTDYKLVENQKSSPAAVKTAVKAMSAVSNAGTKAMPVAGNTEAKDTSAVSSTKTETAPQTEPTAAQQDDNKIWDIVENMPTYPGGQSALMQYLAQTVKYPIIAQEAGVQGRVIVKFIVNADGSISDAEIASNNGHVTQPAGIEVTAYGKKKEEVKNEVEAEEKGKAALGEEAMRVVKAMPKWNPGKQQGKAVRVKYHMPITFRLQ